jgi:hypothetical protein
VRRALSPHLFSSKNSTCSPIEARLCARIGCLQNAYGDKIGNFSLRFTGVVTQTSPRCDGTMPPFLFYGEGLTGERNKALVRRGLCATVYEPEWPFATDIPGCSCQINALQDVVCLKNPAGQRCASPALLGKTMDDSGLNELLTTPPPLLKKVRNVHSLQGGVEFGGLGGGAFWSQCHLGGHCNRRGCGLELEASSMSG